MSALNLREQLAEAKRNLLFASPKPIVSASIIFQINSLFSGKKIAPLANEYDEINWCRQRCEDLASLAKLEISERYQSLCLQLSKPHSLVSEELIHIANTFMQVDLAIRFYQSDYPDWKFDDFEEAKDGYLDLHRSGKFTPGHKVLRRGSDSAFYLHWLSTLESQN